MPTSFAANSSRAPVSVLVPTYNGSELLLETIDSILSQKFAPAEVIILDYGSTDDTCEAVARMGGGVKYHYRQNEGISAARNQAVALAQFKFVAFCDHDDLWRPDKLLQQMELHLLRPDLKFSFTNFSTVNSGYWSIETKFDAARGGFFDDFTPIGKNLIAEFSLYSKLLKFQPIVPSSVVMTKALYDSCGGANEVFGKNPSEYLDLTLRCVHKPPIGAITDPVVGIRNHVSNYSGSDIGYALGQLEIISHALENHSIGEMERAAIIERMITARINTSYYLFADRDFETCRELLSAVPSDRLDRILKIKLLISKMPLTIALVMHSLVVR
ncbi:glycosyltransferase family 2 protein [Granulicella sp. L60]|jgi:glycosyltransferase involved in cell wall biosynthesis|uniref:glycosyltransferase family 2 protein n=1 Tax=Granulicella sp. L60 TaxID=1641866 RepID=UPI00131D7A9E|nr:glycosyltransferase family A protein [Granulicella sp. L60]